MAPVDFFVLYPKKNKSTDRSVDKLAIKMPDAVECASG